MGFDHMRGCVNFRDVGEFVNLLTGKTLMAEHRLYRGGRLDFVGSAADIHSPRLIVNLRNSADTNTFGIPCRHFPFSAHSEKYQTQLPEVRRWLQDIVAFFGLPDLVFPVLVHCNSGKDRTGIVVAALLKIAGIPDEIIVAEYLLSDEDDNPHGNGWNEAERQQKEEVRESLIRGALTGFADVEKYFRRVNLEQIRSYLLAAH